MFFLLGEIAIQAVVLCVIMYVVARHEADYSFEKVIMVAAGIALGSAILTWLLFERIGFLTIIPIFAFMAYMLVKFCWVSVPQSLVITLIFVIFQTGMQMVVNRITGKIQASMEESNALVDQRMKDTEEARQMMMESLQGAYHGGEMPAPPIPMPMPDMTGRVPPTEADHVAAIQEVVAAMQEQIQAQKAAAMAQAPSPETAPALPPPEAEPEPASSPEPVPSRMPESTPAPAAAPAEQAPGDDWEAARKSIVVSGISGRPGRYIAVVDGNMLEAGQMVSARYKGRLFRWTVRNITLDNLDLEPLDVQ